MTQIKVKKNESLVTFIRKTITNFVTINDKNIRVYEFIDHDMYGGYDDYSIEIDENDKELLTDEELEYLEDNLSDLLN